MKIKNASFFLILGLLLSACGVSSSDASNVTSGIYTSVAQTLTAQYTPGSATETPSGAQTTTPTASQAVYLTSTKASVVSTTANSCDSSLFVADVTIPDNTSMAAGTTFTKTWTLNNNGSCTWNSSYSLKFVSGSQMSGSTTSIGSSIGPTHDLNVSISMTAPSTAGTYTGYWRLVNASGEFFGQPVTVTIVVVAATATLTPTATLTSTVTPVYVIITATPVPTTAPTATTVPTVATTAPVTAVTATTGS